MIARLDDGAQIAYTLTAPAQNAALNQVPILLNRPLGGSMVLWGAFAARLATARPVIAFDPRGVGASSDVPWLFSTRDMARDAVRLLEVLGIARAHVFGLSLGGMVASWMAIDAPRRVARLILASTLPRARAISTHAFRRGLALARCLTRSGVEAEVCLVGHILSSRFRAAHPARVHAIEAAVRASPAKRRNLLALALAAARHSVEPELHAVPAPTLLLFGELDPIARRASQIELHDDLVHSRVEILPGAGHDVTLEQPRLTADRVLDFLSEDRKR